ncbi:MAG: 50S ribosomal protein L17 [Bacteroidetes bacterium ADurb.Bin408]|nr:MAG: 50S ribosomal protein L17 [Bacteroidetes bacterium ADurb.Bin408]
MRHNRKINHLGRTAAHRKTMLSNMAASLILHKKIITTVAKAKALRTYIEPLITKSKEDTIHSRRIVFSYLENKFAVKELFLNIATKISDRPGGYTRILKTGNRLGDNAEMCLMELVDFNEALLKDKQAKKTKTTRRGRSKKAKEEVSAEEQVQETKPATPKKKKAAPKVEEPVENVKAEETTEAETTTDTPAEEPKDESTETEEKN